MSTPVDRILGEELPSGPLRSLILPLAALAVIAAWLVPFVGISTAVPPGSDVAWYTWRAEVLTAFHPGALVAMDGPLDVFGGGYRVATPLLAALLGEVAGMDRYSVSVVLVAGRQALVALAAGSAAYRFWPDPLLFAITTLFAGGILFARPFLGVVDNMFTLLLLTAAVWFVGRRDRPAVVAMFLLVLVAFFSHPPVGALFVVALVAAGALRALLERGFGRAMRADGPVAGAAAAAAGVAMVLWWIGVWGPGRTFADAFHVAPVPADLFLRAVPGQILALGPERLVPLGLIGMVVVLAARRPLARQALPRMLLAWLLPLLGLLGAVVGLRYPFKRAVTGTLSPVLMAAVGTWATTRALIRPGLIRGPRVARAALGMAVAVPILALTWRLGLAQYQDLQPWMTPDRRAALAAASAYLEEHPADAVFVAAASPRMAPNRIWGEIWRGDWSIVRAGLSARQIPRTHLFLGSVEDFLADRPTVTGNPTLDLVSAASHAEIQRALDGRLPAAFLILDMNLHLENVTGLDPSRVTLLGGDLLLLQGPGVAPPDGGAVQAARAAGLRASRDLASSPTPFADPLHLARVALGLSLLLVLPGALAARWFGVRGLPGALGVIPSLSVAMNVASGLIVLAVSRRPLTLGMGWATVALAAAAGMGALLASRRR
ncbi:MAG: hypothetical protein ACRDIX_02025 [Actinomycetota bacterium]